MLAAAACQLLASFTAFAHRLAGAGGSTGKKLENGQSPELVVESLLPEALQRVYLSVKREDASNYAARMKALAGHDGRDCAQHVPRHALDEAGLRVLYPPETLLRY